MARFAVLSSHREDGVPLVRAARDAGAPVRTAADAHPGHLTQPGRARSKAPQAGINERIAAISIQAGARTQALQPSLKVYRED